jgi:hypothetical protein
VNQKNLIRAATVAVLLTTGTAMATVMDPLPLAPGASGSVPNYSANGRGDQTTIMDATCGYFSGASCTTGTSTSALESTGESLLLSSGGFLEAAGTTQLNPFAGGSSDVSLAFIFGGSGVGSIDSVTVSSLAGYSVEVEACAPIFSSSGFGGCAAVAGNAARSSGTGNSVTFTNIGQTSILGFPATDGYVVYTNAPWSALVDPNNFSVDVNGTTLSYSGFGLKAPSSGGGGPVPEPGTLALLGVGLLGVGLGMNRRRRAR